MKVGQTKLRQVGAKLIASSGAAWLLLGAAPASAPSSLAMLEQLEKGAWTLTERDQGGGKGRICLGDPEKLLRLEHPSGKCSRYVLDDRADVASVHYTCAGAGHGHTIIRRETNRLVQIETQGIAFGRPFDRSIEARRVGSCRR